MCDPDERVRVACINSLQSNTLDQFETRFLQDTCTRTKDKKFSVRKAAVEYIVAMFNRGCELGQGDLVSFIPGVIMELAYLDDQMMTCLFEKSINEIICGDTLKILQIVSHLSDRQLNGFISVLKRKGKCIHDIQLLLDQEDKEIQGMIVQHVSLRFPNPEGVAEELHKVLGNARLKKLLGCVVDYSLDCGLSRKYRKELGMRCKDVLEPLIRRIALEPINKDSVVDLLKYTSPSGSHGDRGSIILM